jgi:rhamnogalacturonan endolyase
MPRHAFAAAVFVSLLIAFVTRGVCADAPAVTIADKGASVVLANGSVSAEIAKSTGDVLDIVYDGKSVLASRGYLNLHAGDEDADFKDHASTYGRLHEAACTVFVDPRANGGELADLCVAQKDLGGDEPFGVELHYVLRRGVSGLYAYLVLSHDKGRPGGSISQIRWLFRLKDELFDEVAIDDQRRWVMPPSGTRTRPLGPKESMLVTEGPFKGAILDKYHDFVDAGDHFVHGWIGRQSRLGCWMITASTEDQNGGPTKQYNTAHFERILMKIFSCTHYGAAPVSVGGGEAWRKLYGPCLLYFNSGRDADGLWAAAKARAEAERGAWPYAWLHHPDYPLEEERGAVTGRLVVMDAQAPKASAAGAWVGLAAPSPDWQQQSNNYQYWVHADAEGRFTIPHARPGRYTLYAFVDGVMDEYRRDAVEVTKGKADLQTLTWTPVRHGRQLWQIGTPDRTAKEFRHGDDYRKWGLWLEYPKEFPNDVHFVIGKSHERTDWNYAQVNVGQGRRAVGRTWTVEFDLPNALKSGTATLRVALAAATNADLALAVNGRPIGHIKTGADSAMMRAGIHGQYSLTDVPFAVRLLRKGRNEISFTQTAGGSLQKSVMYDCVRLEVE